VFIIPEVDEAPQCNEDHRGRTTPPFDSKYEKDCDRHQQRDPNIEGEAAEITGTNSDVVFGDEQSPDDQR
jgi:hypothetical protein